MRLGKWAITLKTIPFVAVIVGLKYLVHATGWEVLEINPLVSAIVSANIFLLGFLLAGVLSDYKESERLPGEIACSIESLADETVIVCDGKDSDTARACLRHLKTLTASILSWMRNNHPVNEVMVGVRALNGHFAAIEPLLAPPFLARMKQEQNVLRRLLTRVDTIRVTSFVGGGYAIAETTTLLLSAGLVLLRSDQFHESLFIVVAITFVMIYILMLIRDLDNPFDYASRGSSEDVSLRPLDSALARIESDVVRLCELRGDAE